MMAYHLRPQRFGRCALLAVWLALALSAYAPATMAFARGNSVDLTAFVFPDGAVPVICLGDTDGRGIGDGVVTGSDHAVPAVAGPLPLPPAPGIPSLSVVAGVASPADEVSREPAALGLARPRGPPSA